MTPESGEAGVVAAVVTHKRPFELARLMESLARAGSGLLGVVVSDHAPGGETTAIAARAGFPVRVLENPDNPGPGAGWARAAREALAWHGDRARAVWYLDDDVVIPEGGLDTLCAEARREGFWAVAPLLEDAAGRLWAFPEPEERRLRRVIRSVGSAADAISVLGSDPLRFVWCTGACFLVSAAAIGRAGFHREDFWMLGEDLEYSMRLAAAGPSGFTCKVRVPHLPGAAADDARARTGGLVKFCALLQNLGYLSFHCPQSRHMKRYLAGNYRRFFRTYGFGPFERSLAWACFAGGVLAGEPAGLASGARVRARIKAHEG